MACEDFQVVLDNPKERKLGHSFFLNAIFLKLYLYCILILKEKQFFSREGKVWLSFLKKNILNVIIQIHGILISSTRVS